MESRDKVYGQDQVSESQIQIGRQEYELRLSI